MGLQKPSKWRRKASVDYTSMLEVPYELLQTYLVKEIMTAFIVLTLPSIIIHPLMSESVA
jgi:hypothetical protein